MKLNGSKKHKKTAPPAEHVSEPADEAADALAEDAADGTAEEPVPETAEEPAGADEVLSEPAGAAAAGTHTAAAPARRRPRIALIAALSVAAVIAAGAAAGVAYVNRVDTIFPNVSVDGLDIGGLTLSQTAERLSENGYGDYTGKRVSVELPLDHLLTVSAEDVCTETPVSDIALMAWDSCRSGGAVGDALTYLRCSLGGMELESGAAMTVDRDAVQAAVDSAAEEVRLAMLDSELIIGEDSIQVIKGAQGMDIDTGAVTDMIVDALEAGNYTTLDYHAEIQPSTELDLEGIYSSLYAEASDAYYDRETNTVVPETVGVSFDVDAARQRWNDARYGDQVTIPLELTEPAVRAAELEALLFRDELSTKTTSLAGSSSNRVNNVRRASESINGIILMPGEEFSYNPTLGQRTRENGYLLAGAYSGGQTVQEYGGGICQVSSTLYYCALYANLKITSRTCHMFPVGYLPPGLDATVSWGGPEFKFVNDREYPIRIDAAVDDSGKSVTVSLWGTDVDGSYVEVTSDTWYTYDPTYTSVRTGYKAQTYRNVYDRDGNLLSRSSEATSTYNYHKEDIAYPVATPAPVNEDFPTDVAVPDIVSPSGGAEPIAVVSTLPLTPPVPAAPEYPVSEAPAATVPVEETPVYVPPAPAEEAPVISQPAEPSYPAPDVPLTDPAGIYAPASPGGQW